MKHEFSGFLRPRSQRALVRPVSLRECRQSALVSKQIFCWEYVRLPLLLDKRCCFAVGLAADQATKRSLIEFGCFRLAGSCPLLDAFVLVLLRLQLPCCMHLAGSNHSLNMGGVRSRSQPSRWVCFAGCPSLLCIGGGTCFVGLLVFVSKPL